jgi:hypothetical protein
VGKTTLNKLLENTFIPDAFISAENSKTFIASAFLGKVHNAIWLQDEFHKDHFATLPALDFNGITEGHTDCSMTSCDFRG